MSGPKGIFYGIMATPTAAKGTLPPSGEVAFFVDSSDNNFKSVDSSGTVTNITLGQTPGVTALTDGANIATDCSVSQDFSVTLGGSRTFDNPTNMEAGSTYTWIITQDATGSRVATWGDKFFWAGGTDGVLSTAANAVDLLQGWSDGTNIYIISLTKALADS
jgi:hypothetical protein